MEISNIKYKYAFDENGELIDVISLTPKERKDYKCVVCGKILIPILPDKRAKHFRHKIDNNCSVETYFHIVGKLLFEKNYKYCLYNKIPYNIEYLVPVLCNYCTQGSCHMNNVTKKYDITNLFTSIEVEKNDGNFVPDLILKTEKGNKLYIEIAVTHKCSKDKINSKEKIIEFTIASETDLGIFSCTSISTSLDVIIEFHNFNPNPEIKNLKNVCKKEIDYFAVYKNGKCITLTVKAYDFDKINKNNYLYVKKINHHTSWSFAHEAQKAFLEGIKVKNCFLCRYHAINTYFSSNSNYDPIFCKYHKGTTTSNYAAECEIYRPDPKAFDNQ